MKAAESPHGVVSFLFTDVEGSTRRWEADADGMRAALMAHDEVLHAAIEAHGGFMFKHTGDGVCAAFASPKSAVDAAITAQLALRLPVRMGIATGEAELRDGDYFGAVLNRAARVICGPGTFEMIRLCTGLCMSGVSATSRITAPNSGPAANCVQSCSSVPMAELCSLATEFASAIARSRSAGSPTSSVIAALAWPSIRWTTFGLTVSTP